MELVTYNSFEKFDEITHFCTTRMGGVSMGNFASFNLSPFSGDEINAFKQNLDLLAKKIEIKSSNFVIPFQNHGSEIRIINEDFLSLHANEQNEYLNGVDALISSCKEICIGVTTADCVPILFFDTKRKVIAAAHAGWRGTCSRIAEKTILKMQSEFNCNTSDIHVAIGPSISAEFYNVGKELFEHFAAAGFPVNLIFSEKNHQIFLDLWKANKWLIEQTGIPEKQIEVSGICTYKQHDKLFSARRLGIKSGRLLSGIALKK